MLRCGIPMLRLLLSRNKNYNRIQVLGPWNFSILCPKTSVAFIALLPVITLPQGECATFILLKGNIQIIKCGKLGVQASTALYGRPCV